MTPSDRASIAADDLILALRECDAETIAAQLAGLGPPVATANAQAIVTALRDGKLGAAVMTEEAINTFDLAGLAVALADQPVWFGSPLTVLTQPVTGGSTSAELISLLGNVMIVEWPCDNDILISSGRSALPARARQRRMQVALVTRKQLRRRPANVPRHSSIGLKSSQQRS